MVVGVYRGRLEGRSWPALDNGVCAADVKGLFGNDDGMEDFRFRPNFSVFPSAK